MREDRIVDLGKDLEEQKLRRRPRASDRKESLTESPLGWPYSLGYGNGAGTRMLLASGWAYSSSPGPPIRPAPMSVQERTLDCVRVSYQGTFCVLD